MQRLNAIIFVLNDASRFRWLNVKKELVGLDPILRQSDPFVFVWHIKSKLNRLLCAD